MPVTQSHLLSHTAVCPQEQTHTLQLCMYAHSHTHPHKGSCTTQSLHRHRHDVSTFLSVSTSLSPFHQLLHLLLKELLKEVLPLLCTQDDKSHYITFLSARSHTHTLTQPCRQPENQTDRTYLPVRQHCIHRSVQAKAVPAAQHVNNTESDAPAHLCGAVTPNPPSHRHPHSKKSQHYLSPCPYLTLLPLADEVTASIPAPPSHIPSSAVQSQKCCLPCLPALPFPLTHTHTPLLSGAYRLSLPTSSSLVPPKASTSSLLMSEQNARKHTLHGCISGCSLSQLTRSSMHVLSASLSLPHLVISG